MHPKAGALRYTADDGEVVMSNPHDAMFSTVTMCATEYWDSDDETWREIWPEEQTHTVAVLFARNDSHYKALTGVDVWDEARDARKWPGGAPVVAHPPCRLWAKLRQFAKARDPQAEMQLARDAVRHVQRFGGVLEHPKDSLLWSDMGLPLPGRAPDQHGGWTAEVRQCDWGHKAEKLTWLYIVGCHPDNIPALPPRGQPTGVIKPQRGVPRDDRKIVTKAEREHTPPAFAAWLVELAKRCATA